MCTNVDATLYLKAKTWKPSTWPPQGDRQLLYFMVQRHDELNTSYVNSFGSPGGSTGNAKLKCMTTKWHVHFYFITSRRKCQKIKLAISRMIRLLLLYYLNVPAILFLYKISQKSREKKIGLPTAILSSVSRFLSIL